MTRSGPLEAKGQIKAVARNDCHDDSQMVGAESSATTFTSVARVRHPFVWLSI